jgi:hypothetical protein
VDGRKRIEPSLLGPFTAVRRLVGRASRTGPGVSRWAPIRTALDFDFIWDGYDIPFELTRLIRVS